jgi:hypothetical protein
MERKAAAAMATEAEFGGSVSKDFGQLIPFGDPSWYRSWNSPYYNASHHAFRAKVREFTEKEIMRAHPARSTRPWG